MSATETAAPAPPEADLKLFIQRVVDGQELSAQESAAALDLIMTGGATPAQVASLLTALRMRGETVAEVAGFARTMRKHALTVELADDPRPVVDTCGTGGDGAGTFNISTTAAFVVAGAGIRVAKHGNRSVTSFCGSGDVLEGLGVAVQLTPQQVAKCVNETGFGFMFAPAFHPAMKFVQPVRREIGVRTLFNTLGPLTNPAGVRRQLIGVSDRRVAGTLADVMGMLGAERVLFVSAHDGLDEISVCGPTDVVEFDLDRAKTVAYTVQPEDFGLDTCPRESILGGDVAENVRITRAVLGGEHGSPRTVTLINAGAAIYAAGVAASIGDGIERAKESIDSGRAGEVLERTAALTKKMVAG